MKEVLAGTLCMNAPLVYMGCAYTVCGFISSAVIVTDGIVNIAISLTDEVLA